MVSFVLNTQTIQLALHNWYHVSVTFDGAVQKIFLDGTMVASRTADIPLNINTYNTLIGYILMYPGIDRYFPGIIL